MKQKSKSMKFDTESIQLTEEQRELLEKTECSISVAEANELLKEFETGFYVTDKNMLRFDMAMLPQLEAKPGEYPGQAYDKVVEIYNKDFKDQVSVDLFMIPLGDSTEKEIEEGSSEDDENLDIDLRLCLRLSVDMLGTKGNKYKQFVMDIFLHDLRYESSIIKLLSVVHFMRRYHIESSVSGCLASIEDIKEKIKILEKELFSDAFVGFIQYQLQHASIVNQHISGKLLEETGITDTSLCYMYFTNSESLLEERSLCAADNNMQYCLVPKDVSYNVVFGKVVEDIEPYMHILDLSTVGEEDIPSVIVVPDMLGTTTMYNLLTIEWMLKHLSFLNKLKKLKKSSIGDWDEIVFKYADIPLFTVPATLIINATGIN